LIELAVGAAMLVGLFGTLLPLVPGLPLIWAAALVYGWNDGWDETAWISITLITLLMAGGIAAKIVLPQRRISQSGAPRSTLLAGALAGLVGFFVIPVVGLPLGAVAGVLVAEYRRTDDWSKAWVSTKGAIVGFGVGALVEVGAGLAMIVSWVVWVTI
jgi:uncharacterized protein YqgC (DUF456 family)